MKKWKKRLSALLIIGITAVTFDSDIMPIYAYEKESSEESHGLASYDYYDDLNDEIPTNELTELNEPSKENSNYEIEENTLEEKKDSQIKIIQNKENAIIEHEMSEKIIESQGTSYETSGDCGGGITWEYDGSGTIIFKYNGSGSGEMYDFLKNSRGWNSYIHEITNVVFEEGIKRIGGDCMQGAAISTLSIPEGVETIGLRAFEYCHSLKEVTLPSSLKTIEACAFTDCEMLNTINIPEKLSSIEGGATAGAGVFAYCPLENITFDGDRRIIPSYMFKSAYMKQITLPLNITSIGERAFEECTELNAIEVPKGVEIIENRAFEDCRKLSRVTFDRYSSLRTISEDAFGGCINLDTINIPESLTTTERGAQAGGGIFRYCPLGNLTFDGNRNIIPSYMFRSSYIKSIMLPDTVSSIGNEAFYECKRLEKIEIPNNTEQIGKKAFAYCNNLSEARLSKKLKKLEDDTFLNCNSLNKLTVYNRCSTIGSDPLNKDNVFSGCSNINFVCDKGTYAHRYARLNNIPYSHAGMSDYSRELFDLTTDGYPLVNRKESFGYTNEEYVIPYQRYKDVFKNFSEIKYNFFDNMIYKKIFESPLEWNGNCFGLAITSLLFDNGSNKLGYYVKDSEYLNTSDRYLHKILLDNNTECYYKRLETSDSLTELIEKYQIWQKSVESEKVCDKRIPLEEENDDETTKREKRKVCFNEIKDNIENGNAQYTISLKWTEVENGENEYCGHRVVVDSCRYPEKLDDKGWYRIYIYDSNMPYFGDDRDRYAVSPTLYGIKNDQFCDRYVDINILDGKWKAEKIAGMSGGKPLVLGYNETSEVPENDSEIYFSNIDDYPNEFGLCGNNKATFSASDGNQRDINTADTLTVTDGLGNEIYRKQNGAIKIYDDRVKEYIIDGITVDGSFGSSLSKIVYPKGEYTTTFEDGSILLMQDADYAGIIANGDAKVSAKLNDSTTLELTADRETNVTVFLEDVTQEETENVSGNYVAISMNMILGSDMATISLSNNILSVDTPIEQKLDIHVEIPGNSKELKNVDSDKLDGIDIIENEDDPEHKTYNGIWIKGVDDSYIYTGSVIKPEIEVYDIDTVLREKIDYTLTYKNNTKVYTIAEDEQGFDPKKAPSITVTGKGNYDSKEVVYFKILPQDISGAEFSADDITLAGTGKAQKVVPALYWKDKALKNKKDYTFAVYKASDTGFTDPLGDSVKEPGEYVVRLTGTGNFTETRDIDLTVTSDYKLVKTLKIGKVSAQKYTGSAIMPEPEVRDGNTVLRKDEHYTLSYASNTDSGTGYVIVKGIPEKGYAGTRRIGFKITAPKGSKALAYDISEAKDTEHRITVTCDSPAVFMKGGAKPSVTVVYTDKDGNVNILKEGKDYKLTYKNNTSYSGRKSPAAVVTGTGSFKGKRECTFVISEKSLDKVTLLADDVVFKNKVNSFAAKLTLTDEDGKALKAGKDYAKIPEYTYVNDTEVTSGGNAVTRTAGEKVDKTDIIPVDTVIKVTVKAIAGSGYTGTVSGEYKITKAGIASAKVSIPVQTYTGKPINLNKSDIKVSIKGTTLGEDDYDIVSYSNNTQKGTAKVTLRGKGNYGGLKTLTFKIKAKGFRWWWRK